MISIFCSGPSFTLEAVWKYFVKRYNKQTFSVNIFNWNIAFLNQVKELKCRIFPINQNQIRYK